MENNYNDYDKAESSADVLAGKAIDDFVYYLTQHKRNIENNLVLKQTLDSIFTIDFLTIYYDNDDDMLDYIEHLRNDIREKKETASKSKKILKDLDPSTEVKATIIIENLLKVAEKKGGIGKIQGNIYCYSGCYWQPLDQDYVQHYLSAVAEKSGLPHFQATKIKFMELLYKQLLITSSLPDQESSDKEIKINLKNGTFKCCDKEFAFFPFSANDRMTYQLPFEYNPEAKAPKFLKFLSEVIPEKEARIVVLEYIGYIFAKNLRWEKCLVLLGSGGNGKSVLIDIITALLGEQNVCHFSLARLCDSSGYYRAELGNFLLNACSEMGGKNCDPEMVKQLFSNDPVGARSPYGKPITVSRYCRFLFSANFMSNKDMEQTNGYFRRFIFINFNAPIPKKNINTNLAKEIIDEELSGVFNLALKGLKLILQEGRNGFTYSQHIEDGNKTIERNSNSVSIFIDELCYQPSSTKYEDLKILYQDYVSYCESFKYGVVSKQEFLRRLETQLNFNVKRKATNNATWVYCTRIMLSTKEEREEEKETELDRAFRKSKINYN